MWRALVCAIGFLTRIPVPAVPLTDADVARSAGFFSWVGGLIALVLWVGASALQSLGTRLSALVLVALWAWLTAGLHLDGLADTADGLSGGRGDRARTLEIMRDSRIGAHGATALVLALTLKWAALERALELGPSTWLVAPVAARWLCTLMLASFGYAREQGLGTAFAAHVGRAEVVLGALAFVPCFTLFRAHFVLPVSVGAAAGFLLALRVRSALGGLTGDVHGAVIEVSEVATLTAFGSLDLLFG